MRPGPVRTARWPRPDDAFCRLVADADTDAVPDGHLLPSEVSRDGDRRGQPNLHP
jgi:hypothetical protein